MVTWAPSNDSLTFYAYHPGNCDCSNGLGICTNSTYIHFYFLICLYAIITIHLWILSIFTFAKYYYTIVIQF